MSLIKFNADHSHRKHPENVLDSPMGQHKVKQIKDSKDRSAFIQHLLNDIKALEIMLENGMIEGGVNTIGAEQEFCLVNKNWRPADNGTTILEAIHEPHFTSELAKYNLELNLDPQRLQGDCFQKMENQVRTLLRKAEAVAAKYDTHILLTGILPTISKRELDFDFMTPSPRYHALNEMMKVMRGGDFDLHIKGLDQLLIKHDSVLFEACNTSFQVHLQLSPEDFIASYNWAQAIAGPVLAICTNSPLLLGRELWSETRIALFQQSIDTRSASYALKDQEARVSFGLEWAEGSIAEIYKTDIARHQVLFTTDGIENAMEALKTGHAPKLAALNLHNSTIYRWNRPCYGVSNNVAHVRIENRYLPSGPTVADEMANLAFWTGLMMGRPKRFDNMSKVMDFKDAKLNFVKAARTGKESLLIWDDKAFTVRDLIINEFLPIAYDGLSKMGVIQADIEKYMSIIAKRAEGQTGSQWIIKNYRALRKKMTQDEALITITKAIHDQQHTAKPVHNWPILTKKHQLKDTAVLAEHIMSTKLFVINEKDKASLAIQMMRWKNIHHVPVENDHGELSGLLTWSHMERYRNLEGLDGDELTVSDIMIKEITTIQAQTPIKEALSMMKKNGFGCLPVLHQQHLIGIITAKDVKGLHNDYS